MQKLETTCGGGGGVCVGGGDPLKTIDLLYIFFLKRILDWIYSGLFFSLDCVERMRTLISFSELNWQLSCSQ